VGWWAGLVFYLRLSLLSHWCASRQLEHIDYGAPCMAQVKPLISVEVVGVQPDLDSLLHQAVHVFGCRPQFGSAVKVNPHIRP